MRDHEDFIPELDFVLELDGNVIGNIMYTKSKLTDENGKYPAAMMVKELEEGLLDGRKWFYRESPVYDVKGSDAEKFEERFEPMEKGFSPSQEEFYIHSHSVIKG